ncbi:CCA tRNA nucleotidyltransferase 1, mitochondrial-like [Acanthaster planci]|uniref:CCA tRNA nucleotidyltransferase 1, mitochondrial-like n=1 Tax=Acanthaster planci TaxID=133434 RepID=A0A8B7ZT99_ACAPL|nr:CCA tRNA nucleotidyltransferase 1, mitochondrial-like [Acanthaster planci]XP_022106700.1 CCA tRNA nucleotidyltransferase 1, mitochondrial-like [Acanthaster planci]XP_022106701.1 CCA tRNA nucleotidyltransferase 1, mitochondrial-like [Acanthaster planci]XP_022106702.1 CCA tRNA nucleotidyltransferase 1, mitochondrial-like [Acanthaster planci]
MCLSSLWPVSITLQRALQLTVRQAKLSFSSPNCSRPASTAADSMKLDTPEFRAIFTPELKQLAEIFRLNNHELKIAGGAVRDLLMGKQPQDIDFATTATPAEMKEMFEQEGIRMLNTKGEQHGTITARLNNRENFEVTTLRVDRVTDGRHAEVEFTRDWRTDAERRDLTINSMFLGLDGTLVDFFNGKEDLEHHRVAFVGDPTARIREDFLRILRYFRFYGRIADQPNQHCSETLQAIQENGDGLAGISGERIWLELKKIVTGNHAASLMECMHDLQLTQYMGLPPLTNITNFRRVWARSKSLDPKPMTFLSSLLKTDVEVLQLEARLKISADERKTALFIITERDDKYNASNPLKPYQDLVVSLQGKEKNILAYTQEVLKYRGDKELLERLSSWEIPRFPITGKDLITAGVPKGREFGQILERLRERWMESNFRLSKEELLKTLDHTTKSGR